MANLSEITRLFTKLAYEIHRPNSSAAFSYNAGDDDNADGVEISEAISSLTESLNADRPRVKVLDAALSLMCFQAPEVFGARIECLVRTLISVLNSMTSCKVCRFGGRGDLELVRVGSSISSRDCDELISAGANVLQSLKGKEELSSGLLYAILKAAVLSSSDQMSFFRPPVLDEENERMRAQKTRVVSKLIGLISDDFSFRCHNIPLRLFTWYLDPIILKRTISEILRETTERPFLCLKGELRVRMSWRSFIICLVTSPAMFIETRVLLHTWFLLTGLASIWKLQIAIVSSVLDTLSRPMSWDIPLEMGVKFPFSHAYFPKKHSELLAILTGPISSEGFLNLVHHIGTADIIMSKYQYPIAFHASRDICGQVKAIHKTSTWAMLMDFPAWFYFAIILVFCRKDSHDCYFSKHVYGASTTTDTTTELQKAAAFYLSWFLAPLDGTHYNQLSKHILEMARSWTMTNGANCSKKQSSNSRTYDQSTLARSKKLRIPKVNDSRNLGLATDKSSSSAIGVWLNAFDGSCAKLRCETTISHVPAAASGKENTGVQLNCLLLSIPLGILITCSSHIDVMGCELLLHYATTGQILQLGEMHKDTSQGSLSNTQALDGACLVFNLFDIIEDISVMLFDCENTRATYISQLKSKVTSYLLRCIKTMLELPDQQFLIGDTGERAKMDLAKRLNNWLQQGQGVFEGYMAFDTVISLLGGPQ